MLTIKDLQDNISKWINNGLYKNMLIYEMDYLFKRNNLKEVAEHYSGYFDDPTKLKEISSRDDLIDFLWSNWIDESSWLEDEEEQLRDNDFLIVQEENELGGEIDKDLKLIHFKNKQEINKCVKYTFTAPPPYQYDYRLEVVLDPTKTKVILWALIAE